jgi:nickel/cobalt transporter (NicO) family protein
MEYGILLYLSAASIGAVHTLLGPDHYVPFIFMSQAGKWSHKKTLWITILCGLGHIGSSVILGLIGVAFGITLHKLTMFETIRGNIAAWLLIAFGLIYLIYGLRKAYRNKKHTHWHQHSDGDFHVHDHNHHKEHIHVHNSEKGKKLTPWILFTIFIFGPCEPLIPLVMYPASKNDTLGTVLVCIIFGLVTILTMTIVVMFSLWGLKILQFHRLEKYTAAIAGGTVLLCGLAIQFLGV